MTGPIPVATAFIIHEKRVLLLLRPKTAPTYPGKWSGVSGLVEGNETPEKAAVREAREETGLSIELVAKGEPFVTDRFMVHPFLASSAGDAVALDWENEAYAWVDFNAVKTYDTVPGVREAFETLLRTNRE